MTHEPRGGMRTLGPMLAVVVISTIAGMTPTAWGRNPDGTLKLIRVPTSTHPVLVTPGGRFSDDGPRAISGMVRCMLEVIGRAGFAVDVDFPEPGTVHMTATDEQGETWQVTGDDEIKAVTALADALNFVDLL